MSRPASPLLARMSPRFWRGMEEHLGSRDVAHVIYGSIVGLALVVALQGHPPTAGSTAAIIAATGIAIGLAELYSEIVATEARTRQRMAGRQIRAKALESLPVVFGASFPALFFVLAAAGVMGIDAAFTISKWTGLGLIAMYAFLAARLTGSGLARSLVHAALMGSIAGALILLKSLLH